MDEVLKDEVEKFVLKIVSEMIYKGSGAIFKSLMALISRLKHKNSLKFLAVYFEGLIKSR